MREEFSAMSIKNKKISLYLCLAIFGFTAILLAISIFAFVNGHYLYPVYLVIVILLTINILNFLNFKNLSQTAYRISNGNLEIIVKGKVKKVLLGKNIKSANPHLKESKMTLHMYNGQESLLDIDEELRANFVDVINKINSSENPPTSSTKQD
jgi:hypothetical protein